jgi:hypothetical protein
MIFCGMRRTVAIIIIKMYDIDLIKVIKLTTTVSMRITNKGENLFLCFDVQVGCCRYMFGSTFFLQHLRLSRAHSGACRWRFHISCGRGTSWGLSVPDFNLFCGYLRQQAILLPLAAWVCEYNLTCTCNSMLMVSMRLPVSLTTTAFGGLSNFESMEINLNN